MKKKDVVNWLNDQFGGDKDTIDLVWDEYLRSATEKLAEAKEAAAAGDFPLLDRIAHTLKGNALMVGDQASATAAIVLRNAAKLSAVDDASKAIATLEQLDRENRA